MDRRDQGEAGAENNTCLLALLPDDVLADVLRRLTPRGLAMSRCVCKSWRAIVDTRRMLRADLLPLSLGGLFINFHNYYISEFFAPISDDGPCISGKHDYLPEADSLSWGYIDDHCNGLVLIHRRNDNGDEIGCVLNPATRWLAPVPPCPPPPMEIKRTFKVQYLVYDPIESPYFQVVSITRFHWVKKPGDYRYDSSRDAVDPEIEQSEWPPSVCILHVFSSRTRQWEEKTFAREGDSMGTVSDMRHDPGDQRNAVYWRGALYVHCQTNHIMRLPLSSDKYHVIRPPPGLEGKNYPQFHHVGKSYPEFYLGKSSNGVYCASVVGRSRVQVWNLDETGCQMEWVLKHDRDLSKWLWKHKLIDYIGPWTMQNINYYYDNRFRDHDMEAPTEEKIESNLQASEDENFTWSSDDECGHTGYLDILGFHPYKEIIFLSESIRRGFAYHLNSSKVEVLGNIYPAEYDKELGNEQFLESSFPYTPCLITQTAEDGE